MSSVPMVRRGRQSNRAPRRITQQQQPQQTSSNRSRRQAVTGTLPNQGSAGVPRNLKFFGTNELQVGKIPLFPDRFKCMLRYAEQVNFSSAAGILTSYIISANGLYDPDISGTGHQPAGFDQIMASYEHYCVVASNIRATFTNTGTSSPSVAINVNSGLSPNTSVSQLLEDGNVVTTRLAPAAGNGNTETLELGVNVARYGGVDDLLDNPYYRGDVASNPIEQQYYILNLYHTGGVASTCSVDFIVEYTAYFKEPRKIPPSILRPLILTLKKEAEEKKRSTSHV